MRTSEPEASGLEPRPGDVETQPVSNPWALPALGALLGYASFAQGGFYWRSASVFALGLVVLALVAARPQGVDFRPVVAGFGLLAVGLLLPAAMDGWHSGTRLQLASVVVAGLAFVVTASLIREGQREALLGVLGWIGALVASAGLAGVAFHLSPWALRATGGWRATSTLTYSNALGALLVMLLPAPVLLARARDTRTGRLAVFLILAGTLASLSRGAFGALLVLAAAFFLAGGRESIRASLGPILGAFVALGGLVPSILGHARPVPAIVGIVLGAAIAVRVPSGAQRRLGWRWLAAAAAVPIVAAGILLATGHGARFLAARLGSAEGRGQTWSQTWRAASGAPVFGIGPGRLRVAFVSEGHPVGTAFAHNEFLQTLAETGVVGLAGVLAALGLFLWWALRRRPRGTEGLMWAVALAACAGFVGQSGFDLMWRFPVLVAVAFLWLAAAGVRPPGGIRQADGLGPAGERGRRAG